MKKLPWSFRLRQAWELIVHGTDTRYESALQCLQEEAQKLTMEENEHLCTLADRDVKEEWADQLANAIAAHFREDIGEHSNLNNPWRNALELIEGTFCR